MVRFFALAVTILAIAPAAASAVTVSGGLQQLPSPNDCVSSNPASTCGTLANGGLGSARSVAITPDGANAYVASTTGSLTTFGRDQQTGALSFTTCVKDPTSTEACPSNVNRPLQGASSVVANDDFVYVASPSGNAITEFSRAPGTGQLTVIGCISQTGVNPVTAVPACQASPGLTGVSRLALSDDNSNLYAVSPSNSTLVTLNIVGGGTLTASGCFRGSTSPDLACGGPTPVPGLNGANSVDVSPDSPENLTVYVTATAGGASNVSYLTAWGRGINGALTAGQCFHSTGAASDADAAAPPCASNPAPVFGLNGADGVRTSPDGKNLYVASGESGPAMGNSLVTFNRTTTGILSANRCLHDAAATVENCGASTTAVGLKGAFDIAMPPDGKFLYVTADFGNDVAEFSRNTTTGDLTQLPGPDKCIGGSGNTECTGNNTAKGLGGASGIELSPNGLFAYVAAPNDSAVSEFSVERPPVCENVGPINTPHNQPVTFTLPCTDPNPGDVLTCAIDSQPADGTVVSTPPNSCTVQYTPTTGTAGSDTFTYHATDPAAQNSNTGTGTVDVQAAGAPTVTIADAAVDESAGTMTFQLNLSQPVGTAVNVPYETRDGTAFAPGDYTTTNGTATFAANMTTTTIDVPIVDGAVREPTQSFFVDLTGSSTGTAIARPTATGTIADNDASAIGIGDVTVNENAGNANFTITLTNPSETTVAATYSTSNGSAVAPGDYTAQSNKTVSFAPGEVSKQISVPIVNDSTPEQTEQFNVTLAGPTGGATLGKSQGLGTIQDEDPTGVSVSDASIAEGNSGTRVAAFTVALSTPISRTVTVNYETGDKTAFVGDGDYVGVNGTLTFAPGETSKVVDVPIQGDTKQESDEAFELGLSSPTNAAITRRVGTGTILDDDTTVTQAGLSVSDTAVVEGNSGTRAATFTVSLTQPVGSTVTVTYATEDRTALAASDYNSGTGVLTFAPGETSKPVTVPVRGDTRFEPDERFRVTLSAESGAPVSKRFGTGTIVNDDRARPAGLPFTVTPSRDRTAPYRFTGAGSVTLPAGVSRARGCTRGNVRMQYRVGTRLVATRTVPINAQCRFRGVTVFQNATGLGNGRLRVTPRFSGNSILRPLTGGSRSVRAG